MGSKDAMSSSSADTLSSDPGLYANIGFNASCLNLTKGIVPIVARHQFKLRVAHAVREHRHPAELTLLS